MKQIDETGIKTVVNDITYYQFDCVYVMEDGSEWTFNIWAKDWQDADERIKMIKLTVRNSGQIMETTSMDE